MKFTLEKKLITLVVCLTAAVISIIVFIILPTVQYIRQIDKDTYELRQYLERKYERTKNLRSSLKQIQSVKEETASYPEHIFKSGQELQLITTLENMASKNLVNQRISKSNLDNITNQKLTLTVELSGSYHNTLHYLADLESLPYFLNVTKLHFAPQLDRLKPTTTSTVNMSLDLNLYVAP